MLLLGLGCASAPAPLPDAAEPTAFTADRVYEILKRHGVAPTPADEVQSARAFEAVLRALDPTTGCATARARLEPWRSGLIAALRAGDTRFVRDAARRCVGRALAASDAQVLALDAMAKSFDPHSSFVPADRLTTLRDALHNVLPEDEQARGRIVELGGARVGLVVLPSFYLQSSGRSATRDVRFIAAGLLQQGAASIVLDLRSNRGGVITEAVRLAAALGCSGPIARVQLRDAVQALPAETDADTYRGQLAVLVDAETAGVSEVFAAAVQDQARGRVAGARTRGHGSAQTLVLLRSPKGADAGGVNVTDRYFLRLDGAAIEGRGVTPDLTLALPSGDTGAEHAIAQLVSTPPR